MNERDKILLRYVCDGDMKRARQQAKLILENTTAKKDEHFRYEMLRKLETKSNFIELPANLQGILVAEDSAADVAPVVRCKDCKHYDMGVCLEIYSVGDIHSAAWQKRKPEDFCSYGERNQNQ